MKLSIIICLYNTDPSLLTECLDSIERAVLPTKDYEIIVVDDGSDVNFDYVIKQQKLIYEKQKRAGTLSARLRGIELARGEYIAFVDSDDTVGLNYYAPMIRLAEQGFDIVFNAWAFHTKSTRYVCKTDDSISGDIFSDDPLGVYFSREGKQHSYYVLWNKIYRSAILKSAAYEISRADVLSPFCFSEDTLINLFAFSQARKTASIKSGYYYYRIHSEQTVNTKSKENLLHQISCMSYTLKKCREKIAKSEREAELTEKIDAWCALMARNHFAYARQLDHPELYPLIKEKYGTTKLEMPTPEDGRIYEKVRLLPKEVEKIEDAILAVCRDRDVIRIKKPKKGGYAELLLHGLAALGKRIEYRRDYPSLPGESISPLKRLIFAPCVRRIGARLFKKGSRIRAFLKRFI